MLEDIYTRKPIVTDTEEHVVPNALGGRLKCRDLIDESTNHRFGTTIDAALSKSLHLIRILLGANSGDGRPAPVLKGMTSADGEKFNLRSGGLPEVGAPEIRVEEQNGQVKITGHARSEGEVRRLLARTLATYGKNFDDVRSMMKAARSHAPRLSTDIKFDPESWRSIAKIACNLFAAERRQDFLAPSFDAVRRFVNSGEGDAWDFAR